MEGYARHSRSQTRAAAPLPPSSAGAAFYNKSCTNDAAAGKSGFMAYDDVFGGPPKFGATPFAPRAEDYSEIFESYRSGRASSIPMLDLPPVDDSVSAFEALGCSGFEYSEIFGGFEFADFAVTYDELFRRSDASEESSDDAWTPVGTESLSGESDPYASPGRNQYFLNDDFHDSLEENMFNASYQNVNLGSGEDSELNNEARVSSVPGYTCVVDGFSMRKEEESIYSSGVVDDIILCEDASEKISVETPWKTTSMQSHGCLAKQSRDYDRKDGEAHEISPISSSGSVSDVSLKTDPSQLPPSSRPPTIVERKTFPACSISDYDEQCKSNNAETISEGGSLDLFDVELNAGSSSITSAAAMKEAMDDGTKVRLNNDKDLMKRKNDGVKDTSFMNNDFNTEEKVRMVFDESILRDDELQSTNAGESNVAQVYWEDMQDATEASQVLPDPLQPEDAVNGAAESNVVQVYWEVMQDATEASQVLLDPLQPEDAVNGAAESNVVQVYWDDVQDATEASQVLQDPFQPEDAFNGAEESAQITIEKNLNSSLDPGLTEGDCEWKVTAECYELVTNCNSETETSLLDNNNIKKPVQEMNNCHFGNANGSTVSVKQLKQDMETVDASITENVDLKSVDEVSGLKENRRRLRATKAASRNEFHEKMVKLAQNVHGTVISDHVETVKRRKDGPEGDGADWNPETGLVGEKKETRFDPAAQQLHYEKKHKEEGYLAGSEIRSEDDLVLEKCDKKGNEDCWSKENKRIGTEVAAREETPERVTEVAEREDNERGLDDAYQTEVKEEACPRKGAEAMKRVLSPGDENLSVLNEALQQKADEGKAGRNEKQDSDVRLKKTDEESRERVNEMWEKETQKADQSKKSVEEATIPDYYGKKLNVFFDPRNHERHDVATEMKQLVNAMEMMYGCSALNEEQKMERKGDLETELKITEQDNDQETNLQMDTEYFMSSGRSTLDETDYSVPETACECEEDKSSNVPTNLDEGDIKSIAMARECEEKLENHAAEQMHMDEEKAVLGSSTLFGEMEPKAVGMADICMSTKYLQKTEAGQYKMSEWEGNVQKQSLFINTNQRLGKEAKADVGDLDAEVRENAEKLERNEESERERLREIQLEKARERERELEKEILRKFEEEREREREREIEMEKEILRKFEEERERERERELEKEILKKFEEERERERERELEKERLRKVEEEREKELEKLRLRRLEELREREREKELEKDHLRKLEQERQREREKDLEKERLRKIEEEWEREREREKDRMSNEFKFSAARERASVEARERAERPAVDRATAEARQRAMTEARERLEKACAEAREKSLGKASKEAQLRAERAAVERATAEARDRAIEKAMAERATFETRERVERSVSEKFSSSYRNVELRHTSSSNDLWNSSKSNGVEGESNQRCKARLERHHRTVERVAKALAEKNMRDLIAQREQAERSRLAETLDVDIKRWSSGKEGNLRALLSTLQYILGPDSGWQPIPLTEVITSAAIKKAYRKATLCVHPDKLQQRGATIQQKYICEKVFDLLKDAWNRFNSEER